MATVAQPHQATVTNVRPSPIQTTDAAKRASSGIRDTTIDPSPMTSSQPPTPAPTTSKKAKGKKNADPVDASKQIAAKIAQLEQDAAGEKDQEAEIGGLVKLTLTCLLCRICVFVSGSKNETYRMPAWRY